MKDIDCMAQHLKIFHEQSKEERTADFGEPCKTCCYAKECDFNWLSVMKPLLNLSEVRISMVKQGH